MDVQCVLASIALMTIMVKTATNRALATIEREAISKEKAATSLVPDTTAKAATSNVRMATSLVHVTTAKAAISKEKTAISLVHATIVKAVISLAKDTSKEEAEVAIVRAQPTTILMLSTA